MTDKQLEPLKQKNQVLPAGGQALVPQRRTLHILETSNGTVSAEIVIPRR